MRNAARTDGNQISIVEALRAVGAKVYYIKEPLDLLVAHRGRTILIECKLPGEKASKTQQAFIDGWPAECHVVHNTQEALEAVLGKEAMR